MRKKLNDFEKDFAIAAVAIDTLWGGNYRDETGEAHLIVDGYCSGMDDPEIRNPELRKHFLKEGVNEQDPEKVRKFLKENVVENRLGRVSDYASRLENQWRREYLQNIVSALEVILNLRKNLAGFGDPVSDEQAYITVFGREPELMESYGARENLREKLAAVGLEHTGKGSLVTLVDRWTKRDLLTAKQMFEQWGPIRSEMNVLTEKHIFPFLPDWVKEIPKDAVEFGIITEDVHYSGVNMPKHTIKDGKPVYKSIVKISHKVTRSSPDYKLGVVAHEGMPGHGLHNLMLHNLYARGEYGFETSLMLMCTSEIAIHEGVASSAPNLVYGSKLENNLDKDELVAVAKNDLEVIGRNNVVVRYIKGEKDPNVLIKYLREEFCFTQEDANKYVRGWLFNPKMGKLLGIMYLPAYGIGRDLVKSAIEDHGREKVIPFVYGTLGPIDAISFNRRLTESVKASG